MLQHTRSWRALQNSRVPQNKIQQHFVRFSLHIAGIAERWYEILYMFSSLHFILKFNYLTGTPYNGSATDSNQQQSSVEDSGQPSADDPSKTTGLQTNLKYHNAPVVLTNLPSTNDSDGLPSHSSEDRPSSISRNISIEESSAGIDATQKISHPTRTLYYPSLDKCSSLESDLQVLILFYFILFHLLHNNDYAIAHKDFVSSLFWVLESKRLVAISSIDRERQQFLCAPFERKDLIGTTVRHLKKDFFMEDYIAIDLKGWTWNLEHTASVRQDVGGNK